MLYTSRGNFREYHILAREAKKCIPCRFIPPDKLKAGQVAEEIKALLALPNNFPPLPTNGAETCADIILDLFRP
jgi:hypothetical protein